MAYVDTIRDALLRVYEVADEGTFVFDAAKVSRLDLARLRQAMLADVPTLAFNSATVEANHSGLTLEQLLMQISFVVLRGEGDTAKGVLDVAVPVTEPRAHTFYVNDLAVEGADVVQPLIPLFVLQPGERIRATFYANRDVGSTSPKYCPLTVARNPVEKGTGEQRLIVETRGAYTPKEVFEIALTRQKNTLYA